MPLEQGQQAQGIKVPNRVSAGPAQEDTMYRERLEKEAVQGQEGILSGRSNSGKGEWKMELDFGETFLEAGPVTENSSCALS